MGVVRMGLMAVMLSLTTLGWGLAPSVASAQSSADEEARALFEAGRLAFSRGRYEQALGHFQEAYELSHRSALLYNIGTTHDRLRQDQQAIDAFEQFLEAEPDSDLVPEVQERVRILRENQRPNLSPEAVAAASETDSDPATPAAPSERDNRIVKKWWFWTIIGVVVVGAAVGIGVGASGGGGQQGALPYDANTITVEL